MYRAAEQVIPARRLDCVPLKFLCFDEVEGCSLGAAEFRRSAATLFSR